MGGSKYSSFIFEKLEVSLFYHNTDGYVGDFWWSFAVPQL